MDKVQQATLERFGYAIEDVSKKAIPRLRYFNKQGEPLTLPADPYHMERYLKRGFTLTPATAPEVVEQNVKSETSGKSLSTEPTGNGRKRSRHKKTRRKLNGIPSFNPAL